MNAMVIVTGVISLIVAIIVVRAIGKIFKFIILFALVACVALWLAMGFNIIRF